MPETPKPSVNLAPAPEPPALVVGPLPARDAVQGERVVVEVQPSAVGYRLRVPIKEATGVAAFMRGPVAWIVFDTRLSLDLSRLQSMRNEIGVVDVMPIESPVAATVLRLSPPGRAGIGVLRESGVWIFELGPRAPVALRPVDPIVRGNPDGSGGRLIVDLPGGRAPLRIRDPEVKDELQIVGTTTVGAAVATARIYPDYL
ncbi:MAG: hypothetical protein FJX57_21770, partial [Alphaproteobacteria bacterium]|nr:hypothetical protein [Alphaproteobacteria bacterium]